MKNDVWEEIHGFQSQGEYHRFCNYIEGQVAAGLVIEREADPQYGKGLIFGGRWFQDLQTKEIWRLIAPDIPFKGLWEKVDLT